MFCIYKFEECSNLLKVSTTFIKAYKIDINLIFYKNLVETGPILLKKKFINALKELID